MQAQAGDTSAIGGNRERARRDELATAHMGLVIQIARQVRRRLPPCFDLDDLIGAGNQGLLRAAERYRPGDPHSAPFPVYARSAIRGAMLDSVRAQFAEATRPGLDESREPAVETNPCDAVAGLRAVEGAIGALPPMELAIIVARYSTDECSFAAAGRRIGVSGERARQLHARALARLRRLRRPPHSALVTRARMDDYRAWLRGRSG